MEEAHPVAVLIVAAVRLVVPGVLVVGDLNTGILDALDVIINKAWSVA